MALRGQTYDGGTRHGGASVSLRQAAVSLARGLTPPWLRSLAPSRREPPLPLAARLWREDGEAALAAQMYDGTYCLAGHTESGTPDTLFAEGQGTPAWRAALMGLDWLPHFSASPKKLHACYAARMVEAWDGARPRRTAAVAEEARILHLLAAHLPVLAARLEAPWQRLLAEAHRRQAERLLAATPRTAEEASAKGLALLQAGLAGATPAWTVQGTQLLERALPGVILPDGGPAAGSVARHLHRATALFQFAEDRARAGEPPLAPLAAALDRLGPFLSLLKTGDTQFAFAGAAPRLAALMQAHGTMQPLALAHHAGFARLARSKACVVAALGSGQDAPALILAHAGANVLEASLFAASEADIHPGPCREAVPQSSEAGALMDVAWATQARAVFVSAAGDDMRVCDSRAGHGWMRLVLPADTRVSVTRQQTSATLALPSRAVWQLTVRGARILPQQDDGLLLVEKARGSGTVEWALKKVARAASARKTVDMDELPL